MKGLDGTPYRRYGTEYHIVHLPRRDPVPTTRDRLIDAAFALFEEKGFEATTVDDVASRAGVGRTTFFRAFRSKEDAIFPDHTAMLGAVRDRLDTATSSTALVAVTESARLVLDHYLSEGDRARLRYGLTRSVSALRDREIASLQQYQDTFRAFIHHWMGSTPDTALRAELMANAVVTAHNHVLRRWLRGTIDADAAVSEFAAAMDHVGALFDERPQRVGESALVVLQTTRPLADLMPALRALAEPAPDPSNGAFPPHPGVTT
jgi:AcrR family transcriptional regulator